MMLSRKFSLFVRVIKKMSTNYGTIRTLHGQALKEIMKCYQLMRAFFFFFFQN